MVDPVSNEGLSKIAEKSGAGEGASGSEAEVSFQEVLDGKTDSGRPDEPSSVEGIEAAEPTGEVERVEMQQVDAAGDVDSASAPVEGRRVKLESFMEGISEDKAEVNRLMERTIDGAEMDQKELLEMQALIYSYSQKVEIASKVVEKGTGGLKQMMNMRV